MNSNFNFFAAIGISLALNACIPEPLELDLQPIKPKLVLHSILLPDQSVAVQLSTTLSALAEESTTEDSVSTADPSKLAVLMARVAIIAAGDTFELKHYQDGIYRSKALDLFEGIPYTLLAYDSLSRESVRATAYFYPKVNVKELRYSLNEKDADTTLTIQFYYLNDPASEDFYLISAQKVSTEETLNSDSLANFSFKNIESRIFQDEPNAGVKTKATAEFKRFRRGDNILISIARISEKYHDYLKLRGKSTNWYSELTREALTFPSNVENGYGFFQMPHPTLFFIVGVQDKGDAIDFKSFQN